MPKLSENVSAPAATWTKPQLNRIGTIADVSANAAPVNVQNPNRS